MEISRTISSANGAARLLLLLSIFLFSMTPAMSAEIVNINKADVATMIENWKGIGEVKARSIIAHRKKNGAFSSIEELANVKGIGEGLIKKNRKYMSAKSGLTKPSGKSTAKTAKAKTSSKAKPTKKSTTDTAAKTKTGSSAKKPAKKSVKKSTRKSTKKPAKKEKTKKKTVKDS